MRLRHIIVTILLLLPLAAHAAIKFPELKGRIVDDAGIIDAPTKSQLESTITAHEQKTSNQLVVVTLKSLQGYPIEEFGYQLGRTWGIGTKEKNNGVLFIIAPTEHKTRIEVGYGLEGNLTDALSKIIIENDVIPFFKRGEYSHGIANGTQSIITALGGSYAAPVSKHNNEKPDKLVSELILFACIGGWVLLNHLFLKDKAPPGSKRRKDNDSGWWDGGGFGGGSGSSGSSGGFDGGGGDFGGGGSSGDW